MTDQEKDRLIVEKLEGDWQGWWKYHSLSTPDGFFWMWNRAQTMEWWNEFLTKISGRIYWTNTIPHRYVNPHRFRDALAEFLENKYKCPTQSASKP